MNKHVLPNNQRDSWDYPEPSRCDLYFYTRDCSSYQVYKKPSWYIIVTKRPDYYPNCRFYE